MKEFDGLFEITPLVAVIVTLAWLLLIVTLPVHEPLVKAPVFTGEIVPAPVLAVKSAVFPAPLKLVTVFSKASLAVMVTLKPAPAVCGLLIGSKVK